MKNTKRKHGMFCSRSRSKKSNDRYKVQLPPGRMGCRNLPEEKINIHRTKHRKGTDNNITEDPPRIEQNISNNKMTQSGEGRDSLAQDKKCCACNSSEHQIKECTKKRNILVKYKERGYTYSERELEEMMEEYGKA